MKKAITLAISLLLVAAAAILGERSGGSAGLLWRNRTAFEQAAEDMLTAGETEAEIPGVRDIAVWGEGNGAIVQFTTGGGGYFGWDCVGVYYSQSGQPSAFRSYGYTLEPGGDGWVWHSESGESYGETHSIGGGWYSFSAEIS